MKLKKFQKEKGITLIALVVTIIVLIILAGISINLILGENGIIKKSTESKVQTQLATVAEQYGFYLEEYYVDNVEEDVDVNKDRENFTDLLEKVYVGEDGEYVYAIKDLSKLDISNDVDGKGEIPKKVAEITELNDVYVVDKNNEVSYIVDERIYGNVETMVGEVYIDTTTPTRDDFFYVYDEEEGTIDVVEDESENHDGIGYYYIEEYEKMLSEEIVVIPSTLNGMEVKKLNSRMFVWAQNLKYVVIPDGVTYIGSRAFKGCPNLVNVIIPDSVTTIGRYAFSGSPNLTVCYNGTASLEGAEQIHNYVAPSGKTCANNGETCEMTCKFCKNKEQREINIEHNTVNGVCTVCGENVISWQNTENGTYAFIQGSGKKWISNNGGKNDSTATSTWTINIPQDVEYTIKYKVSSEEDYDVLTIKLDGTTIVNEVSGEVENEYTTTLSVGSHTITATYSKDGSADSGNDCGYIILEDI